MQTISDPVVIIQTKRTPIGRFQGALSGLSAPMLASTLIVGLLDHTPLSKENIDTVLLGCVLSAGQGQAPARQAALGAGLSTTTGCTTINKMCGSGMQAIMLGHDLLLAGSAQVVIAGGMESMSNAPHLLLKTRSGYRIGHRTLYDHLLLDGLEDPYETGKHMGVFAEQCAQKFGFSRKIQDDFTLASLHRAQRAAQQGYFSQEIVPIALDNALMVHDELPQKARPEKIPTLRPAFIENGTITAANASGISDGAAACILMKKSEALRKGIQPMATLVAHATHSQDPAWFTTAPIYAIEKVLKKAQWDLKDVALFEINEAFAVVTLATMQVLGISHEKVNVHGGACVLGHPIGASGARIVTTLVHALLQHGHKKGIATLCIGGGEATALAIELIE